MLKSRGVQRWIRIVAAVALFVAAFGRLYSLERSPARKTRLPNGFVFIEQEDHSLPLVAIVTAVRAGRIVERPDTNGISALLAKVLETQGTMQTPAPAFGAALVAEGTEFDVSSDSELLVISTVCTSDRFEVNLRRHAALTQQPNLSAAALNDAREKLLRSMAQMTEYPRETGYLSQLARRARYGQHPYGLPNGSAEVIRRLTPKELEEFRARHLTPESQRVIVAGDFDSAKALQLVQELYGKLSAAPAAGPRPEAAPTPEKPIEVVEHLDIKSAHARVAFPAPSVFDEDYHAMIVIETLLAEGRSSRLYRRLVKKERLVQNLSSVFTELPSASMLSFDFSCEPSAIEPACQSLLAEIQRLRTVDVPVAELERAKTYRITRLALAWQQRAFQAGTLGRFDLFEDMELAQELPDRIAQVTATAVRAAARRWLDPGRYILAAVKPKSAQTMSADRVSETTLSNGLRVVLYRDPSATAVGIGLGVRIPAGGPRDAEVRSSLLQALIEGGHTRTATGEQTTERLEAAGTSLTAAGDADGTWLFANASPHNLDEILGVLKEVAFSPVFTEPELADAKRSLSFEMARSEELPEWAGYSRLMNALFPDHPYGLTYEESRAAIKALGVAELGQEHARLFVPSNMFLALAGNLSMQELTPRLEAVFGPLPAGSPPVSKAVAQPVQTAAAVDTMTHNRVGEVVLAGVRFPPEARAQFPGISVLFRALAIGESSLIARRLSDAGILESPSLHFLRIHRDAGLMVCGFRVKPGTAAKAQKLLEQVIGDVQAGGVPATEIEATRALLHSYFVRQFQDLQVQAAHTLTGAMVLGDPDFYSKVNSMYQRVTPDDIKTASRYLAGMRYVLVTHAER